MIKVSDRFEISRDNYCWTLHEWKDGTSKKGGPVRTRTKRYYSTLEQVAGVIIDRSLGDCKTLEEVIDLLRNAKHILIQKLVETEGKEPDPCRHCGGPMMPGQATAQTTRGAPDFPGGDVVTQSPGGPGKIVDCMKCARCGSSVTIGKE